MTGDKRIFQGRNIKQPENLGNLPRTPPPWREFRDRKNRLERGRTYQASEPEIDLVNAALLLRRPLLITGPPGVGKSSLAHAVAYELDLGEALIWPITSKSTLQQGLYSYDALARLHDAARKTKKQDQTKDKGRSALPADESLEDDSSEIGHYIRLGPVGTAFTRSEAQRPSVLLIDEIDKGDMDLPNDLLHLFEEGEFEIFELARLPRSPALDETAVEVFAHAAHEKVQVPRHGLVRCVAFPLVIMTSNGEREFPPAFLRRCLQLRINRPDRDKLKDIVREHLGLIVPDEVSLDLPAEQLEAGRLVSEFLDIRDTQQKEVATDQLLNALYLLNQGVLLSDNDSLRAAILAALSDRQDVP